MRTAINWLNSQSIRNKVLVFGAVMSTVPLLFLSYYYYTFVKAELEERIIEKQQLTLENLSNEIEIDLSQMIQRIQIFSALNQSDTQNSAFYELLQQSQSIEEVVITSDNGQVEKRVSRYELNLPKENERWFPDNLWYRLQSEDQVFGEVEFNSYGQPVMKVAVPFYDGGDRKAVGVVLQLQKIIGKISSTRYDHSAYIYLMDRKKQVIAHQDYSKLWQKNPQKIKDNVLGVSSNISSLGWVLVMEQPKASAYEPINIMFRNGLMAAAILMLIVSLISISAGLYFTKPIVLIDRAMNRLKSEKRIQPITVERNDELGKLADSFNSMSKEIVNQSFRLEQEKERLNVVVSGIGAGLALVTKDYRITWMNPVLNSWLKDKALSMPCYILIGDKAAPCEDCPITSVNLMENTDKLMKFQAKEDEERIFRHRVFPLNHAIEEEGQYLVVLEDITEQKQMEEKIVQTDKLTALGIMASSFAHEVNNPLTTINVYAEDLLDRIQIKDDLLDEEETTFYLTKIKENTERCKRITSNLLNFSRKSSWTDEQINVKDSIEGSLSLVGYVLKKKQIDVDLLVNDNLPKIKGDGLKLMQVIVNLINNAVDAMESGGKLTISAKDEKTEMILKVRDSGHGIPRDTMSKLFDPFYTTKPVGKGTGLGLSVCYGIIEQFGGSIEIQSEIGKGTEVEIRLPLSVNEVGIH